MIPMKVHKFLELDISLNFKTINYKDVEVGLPLGTTSFRFIKEFTNFVRNKMILNYGREQTTDIDNK